MTASAIDALPALVAALPPDDRRVFDRLFRVDAIEGQTVPPDPMLPWLQAQFGDAAPVLRQRIVKVTNLATLEGALFSSLRARRPLPKAEPVDLERDLAATPDVLADPLAMTPADTFGRVRGQHCVTAANVAKADGLHGLVIFDEPNPLRFTRDLVLDYLTTARRWLEAAHAADQQAVYPLVFWNCLWRAGASLAHGHLQMLLGRGMHYARVERLRRDARAYAGRHGAPYFDDLYRAHAAIGAGFACGGVRVMASLTPAKEREVLLLAARWDAELDGCIHDVLAYLRDGLGVTSFNVALALSPVVLSGVEGPVLSGVEGLLDADGAWDGFPALARIVDRGDLRSRTADIGAMELYAASVVSADPLRLAAALREYLEGASR